MDNITGQIFQKTLQLTTNTLSEKPEHVLNSAKAPVAKYNARTAEPISTEESHNDRKNSNAARFAEKLIHNVMADALSASKKKDLGKRLTNVITNTSDPLFTKPEKVGVKLPETQFPSTQNFLISPPQSETLCRENLGGKGWFLTIMQQAGLPVPPFKAINQQLFSAIEHHPLSTHLLSIFFSGHLLMSSQPISISDIKETILLLPRKKRSELITQLGECISSEEFYNEVSALPGSQEIRNLFSQLQESQPDTAFIVRSSGIKEDGYGDAQAGKYDSHVHLKGDILKTCLRVMASGYRPEACLPEDVPQPMAMVIQSCIKCSFGGAIISHSSLQDDTIQLEYTLGQPKGVVDGKFGVTPHQYKLSRSGQTDNAQWIEGNIPQYFVLNRTEQGCSEDPVINTNTDKDKEKLPPALLQEIQKHIETLENMLCCPVDVEFAADMQRKLHIVQVRPVTRLAGGSCFNAAPPPPSHIDGILVSEGCCSGPGVLLSEKIDPLSIPKSAIIHAECAAEWMIEPDVLKRVGGFILKDGGTNDHVAITLRQAGIPCLLAGDQFKVPDGSDLTLVAGLFNKEKGAYLLPGDQTEVWKANRTSLVPDYAAALSQSKSYIKSTVTFKQPDQGFHWLNQQNDKLLAYFEPGRLFQSVLGPEQSKALSMCPERSHILNQLKEEVNHFYYEVELFLQGYEAFLQLAGDKENAQLREYNNELELLKASMVTIRKTCSELVHKLSEGLTDAHEIPNQPVNFKDWLKNCSELKKVIQRQHNPATPEDVKTAHEMILFLHKRFVSALQPVAINSGLGTIQKTNRTKWIRFSNAEDSQFLNDECRAIIAKSFKYIDSTVTQLPGACIITSQNGTHLSTIGVYEKAEGTKGRQLRLSIAEDLSYIPGPDARSKRLWFFAYLLKKLNIDKNSSELIVEFNPVSEKLEIECNNFRSHNEIISSFIETISSIPILEKLHDTFNLSHFLEWKKEDLIRNIKNIKKIETTHIEDSLFNIGLYHCAKSKHIDENERINLSKKLPKKDRIILKIFQDFPFQLEPETHHQESFLTIFKKHLNSINSEEAELIKKEVCLASILLSANFVRHLPKDTLHAIAKDIVKEPITCLYYASEDDKGDFQFNLSAVTSYGYDLKYASKELQNDKEIVIAAVSSHGDSLKYASKELQNDKEIVMAAVSFHGGSLEYASKELQNDKEIATIAIKNHPWAFHYISKELRNNKNIALLAVEGKAQNIEGVSDKLKDDQDVVMTAMKNYRGYFQILKSAGEKCRNNPDIVRTAIEIDTSNSCYIGDKIRNNKSIILSIINQHPELYYILGDELRDDEDIIFALITINPDAYIICGNKLRNNKTFLLKLIKLVPDTYRICSTELMQDKDFIINMTRANPDAYHLTNYPLCDDKSFILQLMDINPDAYKLANGDICNDENFIRQLIKKRPEAYKKAGDELRNNEAFIRSMMEIDPEAYQISGRELCANSDFIRSLLAEHPTAYKKASYPLTNDGTFILSLMYEHPEAYEIAHYNLRNDESFVLKMMKINSEAYKTADYKLRGSAESIVKMMRINPEAFHIAELNVQENKQLLGYLRTHFPDFKH
ncbi:DUF4116 domain-containing protein [uncultured Endozoicomonas sp.]|uniref:DUF4116 domain-containing protein n=1 Tax=uncultured Endozoicomonas sp. TaxID=432652 RepID=UPI0026333E68|nr:DUF4116 domain-containing protein [uncultured Endozoicomonas sp.]